MYVLGIETTCDETAAAVVVDGKKILSNVITSQSDFHQKFGGVFPEQSSRQHVELLIPVIEQALSQASLSHQQLNLISVAKGPGLMGPLLIGLNAAKALALAWGLPFIGVNHVEAHLYAALMSTEEWIFPALGIVLSGGHTFMVLMHSVGHYELIGTTVDDAIGEAFDKVAHFLGLGYPGGPAIESLAKQGDSARYDFKAGQVKGKPLYFSFSGLKTNVLYTVKGQNQNKASASILDHSEKAHVAASFQYTAFMDIIHKSLQAYHNFGCKAIYVGGGVSNSQTLRQLFKKEAKNIPIFWPDPGLSLDNAAMIAGLGYQKYLKAGGGDPFSLQPMTRIPIHSS